MFWKKCRKFAGEHPCWSTISTKLLYNFIEIALRHWCSPVNSRCIFRTPFPKITSEGLLLELPFIKITALHPRYKSSPSRNSCEGNQLSLLLLTTDLMSIITLWTVNIFSIGKELYKSSLIFAKFWLILSVISLFSLTRYLILSQVLSNNP